MFKQAFSRSLSRDLTLFLLSVMLVVLSLTAYTGFHLIHEHDEVEWKHRARELTKNLQGVLVNPLWQLTGDEIRLVLAQYSQIRIVASVKIVDAKGVTYEQRSQGNPEATLTIEEDLSYQGRPAGHLTVGFTDAPIATKQNETVFFFTILLVLQLFTVGAATLFALDRFLRHPFQRLKSGLQTIASGNYKKTLGDPPQEELASITQTVNWMAKQIAERETKLAEHALHEAKLQVAQSVQQSLLPPTGQTYKAAEIAWLYRPMESVGGDWFHIIESSAGDELCLIMGDVTGHGIASGLVTTSVAGALNTLESLPGPIPSPEELVGLLDKLLHKIAGKSNLRMTCVAARISYLTQLVEICNAGHTFPLKISADSSVKSLNRNQQTMLGDENGPRAEYTATSYDLAVGDKLVFFTDGLTEAKDSDGQLFQRRFVRLVREGSANQTATQIKSRILRELEGHIQGQELGDDICLVVVASPRAS